MLLIPDKPCFLPLMFCPWSVSILPSSMSLWHEQLRKTISGNSLTVLQSLELRLMLHIDSCWANRQWVDSTMRYLGIEISLAVRNICAMHTQTTLGSATDCQPVLSLAQTTKMTVWVELELPWVSLSCYFLSPSRSFSTCSMEDPSRYTLDHTYGLTLCSPQDSYAIQQEGRQNQVSGLIAHEWQRIWVVRMAGKQGGCNWPNIAHNVGVE